MATFRSKHIADDTIAMMPVGGYVKKINYSMDSIRWLKYVAHTESINIQHGLNGYGEIKIGEHFVDGFCEENNTVYQYHVSIFFFISLIGNFLLDNL